jgi:hypothetical protein
VRSGYQRGLQVTAWIHELQDVPDDTARDVLIALVEGVPAYRGASDAPPLRELERRGDVGAIPALQGLVARGCAGRMTLAALQALAHGCSCTIHKAMGSRPGPHMELSGTRSDAETWTTVTWGSCALCGDPWTLRQQSRDRGGTVTTWVE